MWISKGKRCFGSQVLRASVKFAQTQAGVLSSGGTASRRRERRLRSFWRHEQLSSKMMAASMSHPSWQSRESVDVQTGAVPTPVDEYVAPAAAPYAATASPIPVTEEVASAPAVTYPAPAPMIDYSAPATPETVNANVAPARVVEYIAPQPAVSYPSFYPSFSQSNEAITSMANPQISVTADEASQVLGSSLGRSCRTHVHPSLLGVPPSRTSPFIDLFDGINHSIRFFITDPFHGSPHTFCNFFFKKKKNKKGKPICIHIFLANSHVLLW